MQGLLLSLSLLASAAVGVLAADDLNIDVTLPVECDRKTKKGDKISVHYSGTLKSNGQKFDASYDRGTPFDFNLGAGMVIKGWDEGLLDMCIGEKRTLTIGPSYGYGQRNVGPIPAGSTLVFETELMGIDGVPKPESIVTKTTADSPASSASGKVVEKVASAVKQAAEVPDGSLHRYPWIIAVATRIRSCLPPLNFITVHYAYFISVCLVMSLVFWGSSNPSRSLSYTDSLFLVVSAMTEAGLNTVNLSQVTSWQQTMLFLLVIFGSSIWVSIWTVIARKRAFEQRFKDVMRTERMRTANRGGSAISLPRRQHLLSFRMAGLSTGSTEFTSIPTRDDPLGLEETTPVALQDRPSSPPHIVFADDPHPGTRGTATSTATQYRDTQPNRRVLNDGELAEGDKRDGDMRHFLTRHPGGRNAQFYNLSRAEREHLGGCEYRALKVLAVIVPLYFVLWQLLGCLALGAWLNNNQPGPPLQNGINPWWLGLFNGASAFNNSGMSLLDANMIPFQNSYFVLITMALLILAGNTAYPIFLRLIISTLLVMMNLATEEGELSALKDTFRFILQYPRRVYTNLFPARATWWLLFMLVLLNSIDWAAFELLNLGNPAIESIPPGSRVLDGLFQAIAVRSGGFYVVPIASVYIGLQVLYVIMMYISAYPVVITMRHSNVYEERSLGIYTEDDIMGGDAEQRLHRGNSRNPHPYLDTYRLGRDSVAATVGRALTRAFTWQGVGARPRPPIPHQGAESRISFIGQQIQGQLAHDLWWLVIAVLVIVTINTSNFMGDPIGFSVFNVIFEVVSAYGCVGISVGLSNEAYSFSGAWHPASKLVLCAVMIRGRHRGLPVALDRAVRLPGEELHQEEEEDHRIRRSMTNRRGSLET
ncbi:cation transport protein-domain-containing protein [Podospora australis]|uniref:peptidylprolyl isomerase n=1 Tax=Podospora australis TaxID=1536484 RepID=A0AAN6WWL2_9PEZI|nr:cation transport protein-domain-containing protein [Podospora australis]